MYNDADDESCKYDGYHVGTRFYNCDDYHDAAADDVQLIMTTIAMHVRYVSLKATCICPHV